MGFDPRAPRYSPDGQWWWDGSAWRPVASQPAPPRPSAGIWVGATIAFVAAVVVVVVVTVSVLGFIGYRRLSSTPSFSAANNTTTTPVAANAVPCDLLEHTQVHYHAALQILDAGNQVAIPTALGRTSACYYWLHMHTGEPGIIHIEAPDDRTFTLSDFFDVWSAWSGERQPIDSTHVSDIAVGSGQKLIIYVDTGAGAHVYSGDPGRIILKEHEVITLEVGPPAVNPPPAFKWPAGF